TIRRTEAQKMMEEVASERMPPQRLSRSARSRFIFLLAAHLWDDPVRRGIAYQYRMNGLNNVGVHRRESLMGLVFARAGAQLDVDPLSLINRAHKERGRDQMEYTPDVALGTALDALDACHRANPQGDIEDCMLNATRLNGIWTPEK